MPGSVSELRAEIEGLYVLEEWHSGGNVFRPPQIEGRFVLLRGGTAAIFVDKMHPPTQVTVSQFGVFTLESDAFAYRWNHRSKFTEAPGKIDAAHALPFEGMRNFSVKVDEKQVKFISTTPDQAEFCFESDKLKYSEGRKLVRLWQRTR